MYAIPAEDDGWQSTDHSMSPQLLVAGRGKAARSTGTPRRFRVLIVDDEPDIVDLLSVLLEDEGYEVLRADNGQEAWDIARLAQPDLIVSDVMMPGMSGIELLARLRGTRELATTPVILMSAVACQPRPHDLAIFLPKPFDIERMLDLITNELGES